MVKENNLEVVSAVAGRIRLRATDEETRSAIEAIAPTLRQQEGVHDIQINQQTGSVIVNFDPNQIQLSQLSEALEQWGISQVEAASKKSQSDRCLEAYEQVLSFVPSIIGILITRWVGVQGWKIIPTYLLSAGATRQVMNQLDLSIPAFLAGERSQSTTNQASEQLALPSEADNQVVCNIVSAVPGRIRFHVPRITNDTDYAQRLQQLAQADDNITAIRINRLSRSIVLTYDTHSLSNAEARTHLFHLIQTAGEVDVPKKKQHSSESEGQPFEGGDSYSTTVNLASPSTQGTAFLPKDPTSEDLEIADQNSTSHNQAEKETLSEQDSDPEPSWESPASQEDTQQPEPSEELDETGTSEDLATAKEQSEAPDASGETQQQMNLEGSSLWSNLQASPLSGILRLMVKLPRQRA